MKKLYFSPMFFITLVSVLLFTVTAHAATLEVGAGKPYTNIQSAINDAGTGDTVLVYNGTYVENINFLGKAITVKSVNGASSTIIDGNASGSVVIFISGEGAGSVMDGFTLTNGTGCDLYTLTAGGGIFCDYSSPVIKNCIISGNSAMVAGGGVYCSFSNPTLINCVISGNWSYDGGGIFCGGSSPSITNCTITGNFATDVGGGIRSIASSPTVVNSILWGDTVGGSPSEISLVGTVNITYSDIQGGWAGSGNIDADPLFVGGGDYHLKTGSPCIDTGTSVGAPAYDIDGLPRPQGSGYDMGAYEYDGPTIKVSSNSSCEWKDTFNGGETVYGHTTLGLSPSTYDLYVVDQRSDWTDETPLSHDLCTQCATTPESSFTTDGSGNMPCGTIIWQNLQTTVTNASFDIIIDVNGNGKFDFSTDFIDSMSVAGFTTLVKLTSFEAIPDSNKVILKWVTESEIDNAGFNLYRATSEDGDYVKINDSLIPAEGSSTSGATYKYVDNSVRNRTTYYYKLEDIDLNGASTMHGPVSAEPRMTRRISR